MNILGPEIWKQLLENTIKLQFTTVVMVTTYTEHKRSRNMEATLRGNHKKYSLPKLYWLLHIQNRLGTEKWNPLLEEILKL